MPIETWFPLAIYYVDLEGAAEQKDDLLAAALALRQENPAAENENPAAAWTGDVHGVQRLHDDPRFAWLLPHLEQHALLFAMALGYQIDKIALHFQRSWPVVASRGQAVFRHRHPTSHLSAVYYIAVPEAEAGGGKINFINEFKLNECSPGLTGHSDALVQGNPLNYTHVGYAPVEGRLLLFPSKISHEVASFEGEGIRVSASFDIAITTRRDELRPSYEFLTPDPQTWRPFGRNHPS